MKPVVLVVGAGPVGLTMASELARFGVAVRIVDKSAGRTDKSKALVIWSRSLELIDRMGCGRAFVDAGLKVTGANITDGRKQIAHVDLSRVDSPHPYALMVPQSETEALMEAHLNSLGVRVERQVELIQFAGGDDEKVSATLRHADGREEAVEVEYLVGCDGAHSTVRHGLGFEFQGTTMPSDWMLADVHLRGLGDKADEINTYWHGDGVLIFFPMRGDRFRVIADLGKRDSTGAPLPPMPDPTLADVQSVIDDRGPGGVTASDPVWLTTFRINERKVADYRAGRVFLAGDAAHIHSPAGGQGMNTGMQDAFNLSWKLALVCRGLAAPEPLLGSYSIERSAVGDKVLRDAGHMTTVAILRGQLVQEIRNHVVSLILGFETPREKMAENLTEMNIAYPSSPLTVPAGHFAGAPKPGSRAPIVGAQADGSDRVGAGSTPRFALFADADEQITALIARFPELLEPTARAPFEPGGVWLVRPDGYVALSARRGELAGVETYLRGIRAV